MKADKRPRASTTPEATPVPKGSDRPPANFADLWSADRGLQNKAFQEVMAITREPVGWAGEVWDDVLANLRHKDNHNRAIAAQVLANLAKSDTKKRMLRDFPTLFAVTGDDRFVTARHCLQSLWKVGLAGKEQSKLLLAALERWFHECTSHKNCTLIRYDILKCLRDLHDHSPDQGIRKLALGLIEVEEDVKYRKKYAALWR